MNKKRKGMLGALMDEYERASLDLKNILSNLSLGQFEEIKDPHTQDKDCKSIQTVICHVVQSGYTYANYIKSVYSTEWLEYDHLINSPMEGIQELDKMLEYTIQSLEDKWDKPMEEIQSWEFKTRWGVTYDIEQLMEHAIVHILRHRRQIENFLKTSIIQNQN
ncbi:DinB family protein [Xanthovirga aplysinae]|uniref:DinB family protein n=1 Tax=Xanthovirga aplysinae TaxID=2529853 RepID=UPI001656F28C|nr:DinB family protein [Xanthovirga aplysinae]